MTRVLLFLGLVFLVGGCDNALDEGVYAGIFLQGFEDSTFSPCGSDEVWQLDMDEGPFAAFREAQERYGPHLYIEARGVPSAKGRYPGIFIEFDRVFDVEAFERFRAAGRGC